MKQRLLLLIEAFFNWLWIRTWPSRFPGWFEGVWSGVFLVLINETRRVRIKERPVSDCDTCGLVYPVSELVRVRLADGQLYPECKSCIRMRTMFRRLAPKPSAA